MAVLVAHLITKVVQVTGLDKSPLAYARFPHPGDWFLFLVLAEVEDGYVIWTYNAQLDSLENGHYFARPEGRGHERMVRAYQVYADELRERTRSLCR
jgi:hypothetical protein